ncbi:methyltransferase domain-containing protein [Shewanella acanthi]|uniref:methyltransferase domain-containing protein n=1 Tax=Shewanella acanthi TaxID=2864212 RepID=UPI001C65DA07|nr:methyltransferase domain-containing protein [Shewanella acanthi]QYJ77472.1 class I SAM-dependent methyltransferase [Shewanella acanthi]
MTNFASARKPAQWEDLPNGAALQQVVAEKLSDWWPRMFGYHLLKMGPLGAQLSSMESPVAHHFSLCHELNASLIGDYCHLPLQNGVIDAVVMSLLLEFEADPYRILRETDRVLIAGGYLVIVGFNPLSPVFIGKLWPKYQEQLPWCGRFFMPSRVRDWLGLLGYQVVSDERLVYHPLIGEFNEGRFMQQTLASWLPSTGSLYLIVARKLESPLTPVRDKRKIIQPNWSTAPTAGRAGRLAEKTEK